jgi:hypothetical protein
MRQLIEAYNDAAQRFEDWVFKYALPPIFRTIEIGMRFLLIYAFYLLVYNAVQEAF